MTRRACTAWIINNLLSIRVKWMQKIGVVDAKNWSSLLIEVTISRRLFVVMPENGIFCEFGFPNGILWEFSQLII